MPDHLFALALIAAAGIATGGWLVVCALIPRQIRLGDAFGLLPASGQPVAAETGPLMVTDASSRLELAGAWCYQHARLPLSKTTTRMLLLRGRSIGDYFCNKLILAFVGLLAPHLFAFALCPVTGRLVTVPLIVGLLGAAVGWFWPDLTMRNQQHQIDADASEALNTFFDLVVLERLANLSATQALAAAAQLSDVPVFTRISGALEQARLEQRAPWSDLHRLADELQLPAIADLADVMRLDDQGAALAEVLQSRLKELRDAQLTRERTRAHQVNERMTLWMSIPVVIFALAFLVPPLLSIAGIS